MDKSLVGKCGLYCGACAIYRAERDTGDLRSRLASNYQCKTEQVRCNGCGSLTSECWGNGCKIVICTKEKGVNHCYECNNYGNCAKHNNVYQSYLEDGEDIKANLEKVKNGLTKEFLEEAEAKFKCKKCGHSIIAGFLKCHICGESLK